MIGAEPITNFAAFQRSLWGATSADWAAYQEPRMKPWYASILDRLGVGPRTRLLDIGCGSGLFLQMASQRGAVVSGLDVTPEFIRMTGTRLPGADLRVGDMEDLPFASQSFDLVTGLNSFQFAASPVRALTEARRVTGPDGSVVVGVFGREADCDLAAPMAAFSRLMPPPPPGTQGPFGLSADGALEGFARAAGLEPVESIDVDVPYAFDDDEAALRCLLANGPAVIASRTAGEERVRLDVLASIEPFKLKGGGYRLENKLRYLVARRRESVL